MDVLKNFVGGTPIAAESEEEIEVPDPATGELLGRVPLSGPSDVDQAVRAATEAFEESREEPVTRRARRMFKLQVLLEEHMEELAERCTRENGKHVDEWDLHATGRDGVEFYTEEEGGDLAMVDGLIRGMATITMGLLQ